MTDLVSRLNYYAMSAERVSFKHDEAQAEPYDGNIKEDLLLASVTISSLIDKLAATETNWSNETLDLSAEIEAKDQRIAELEAAITFVLDYEDDPYILAPMQDEVRKMLASEDTRKEASSE